MHSEEGLVAYILWHFDARGCETQGKLWWWGLLKEPYEVNLGDSTRIFGEHCFIYMHKSCECRTQKIKYSILLKWKTETSLENSLSIQSHVIHTDKA